MLYDHIIISCHETIRSQHQMKAQVTIDYLVVTSEYLAVGIDSLVAVHDYLVM